MYVYIEPIKYSSSYIKHRYLYTVLCCDQAHVQQKCLHTYRNNDFFMSIDKSENTQIHTIMLIQKK